MSELDERTQSLYYNIDKLARLRDAQEPGSAYQLKFQREIEQVTEQLLHYESIAPKVAELDAQIRSLSLQVTYAEMAVDDDPWSKVALVSGVLGGVSLLICFGFDVNWASWVMAIGLSLGSIGAAFLSVNGRRAARDDLDALDAQLKELQRTRRQLLSEN